MIACGLLAVLRVSLARQLVAGLQFRRVDQFTDQRPQEFPPLRFILCREVRQVYSGPIRFRYSLLLARLLPRSRLKQDRKFRILLTRRPQKVQSYLALLREKLLFTLTHAPRFEQK